MSALGHKQTYTVDYGMSALPLKADMCSATRDVRFGPKASLRPQQIARSLNQLVGASEQRRRHSEAECLGSYQVDGQIKLTRLLDWDVAGLRPVQNLVD